MSKMLRMSEEQWTMRQVKALKAAGVKPVGLKVANKQKDVHLAGDKPKRTTSIPTEHQEQVKVIEWCDAHPIAKHIFAIPNGSHKSPAMANKFKREGLRSGVPDLFLPFGSRGFYGLFIEMKRTKGGKASDVQVEWLKFLTSMGYWAQQCCGAEDAIRTINWYLTSENV